ncbi:MAG: FAD-dependent oxidoreductase [Solirubrobacteraceae bacterium]
MSTPDHNHAGSEPQIGVYVCHCGHNIAGKVDVESVVQFAAALPHVAVARNYTFMCSDPGQELIQQDIRDGRVNRVVVASCSPLMHEATFRQATAAGGISPFQMQMASIREHVSWVTEDAGDATEKAKALVAAAASRVACHEHLERRRVPVHPDVLVVGAGISGIHAALTLANAGKRVYLVEREPSIGGHMAMFDKTFPTLDCSACILTPKMVALGQHPNVELLAYSEVEDVSGHVGSFRVKVRRKASYIDETLCNGCAQCIEACTVRGLPSEFDQGLGTRPAVYTPFPQAVPRTPVIDRAGTSPCSVSCPAGIKPHGYVSLIRAGKYEQAFDLVLEETPLVGTLGRACYAPCEAQCSRASLEGTLPIRRLKRFIADYRTNGSLPDAAPPNGKRVAIIGSGPAGLTAAWKLARQGYVVRIFEAAAAPGGMLRLSIPSYRLPVEIVERDIENVTALGVEIVTETRIEDLGALRRAGYDAILVATGAPLSMRLDVPGEELGGVVSGLDFLEGVKAGPRAGLDGKRVVVVGGGNVAMDAARTARRLGARDGDGDGDRARGGEDAQVVMDAARTARRLGAREVVVAYRRGRGEMPAMPEEVDAAEREGVQFVFQVAPVAVLGDEHGRVRGVRCVRMALGLPDASGRARPEPVPGSEFEIACDEVIPAIGLTPEVMKGGLSGPHLTGAPDGRIVADPQTLQTDVPYVFAAGDVVLGASDIARAVGQGRRAAFMIDRFLQGSEPDGASFDGGLPVVDKTAVLARQRFDRAEPRASSAVLCGTPNDFAELEPGLTEAEAMAGAQRCLDCGPCSECAQCVVACERDAIDLSQRDRELELEVGAIIVATGFKPFDPHRIPEYGYGKYPNVYTSLEVERLLCASGPTQGEIVMRDGRRPSAVGIVHCVGSRDSRYNAYCSRVCCMASLKLAHLIKERTSAEIYNFYIDMRTPGKGYEEFYNKLLEEGMHPIRGRAADVTDWAMSPEEEGRLVIRAEDTLVGAARRIPVDMVVLAVGLEPQADFAEVRRKFNFSCGAEGFFTERHPKLAPVSTFADGVFLAGACQGPKDIPDSVAQAGAAAAEALALIDRGSVELEPSTAFVHAAACSGCRTCIPLCPFSAIALDGEQKLAEVNEVLCKGCGICVAACPSGALQQHMFTDEQVLSEIQGVLEYA